MDIPSNGHRRFSFLTSERRSGRALVEHRATERLRQVPVDAVDPCLGRPRIPRHVELLRTVLDMKTPARHEDTSRAVDVTSGFDSVPTRAGPLPTSPATRRDRRTLGPPLVERCCYPLSGS